MIRDIEINGKSYPCVFSFSTMALFMDKTSRTAAQIGTFATDLKLSEIPLLLWCGFKKGHEKQGKDFSQSVTDVENWIDDNPGLAGEVMNQFNEAQPPLEEKKSRVVKKRGGKLI